MNQTDRTSSSFLDLTTLRMLQSHNQDKHISVQNSISGADVYKVHPHKFSGFCNGQDKKPVPMFGSNIPPVSSG